MPLYTPTLEENFKEKNSFPDNISLIKQRLLDSDAIIWCSPEYNGGISPILTNVIAWISRTTTDWKEGFQDKHSLICTSSGGNGNNFIKGFSLQLNYLGALVMERSIIKTKKNDSKAKFGLGVTAYQQNDVNGVNYIAPADASASVVTILNTLSEAVETLATELHKLNGSKIVYNNN